MPGPASRSMRSAASSSPRPDRRRTISTAPTATATTCSRTPSCACARPPASACGTSRASSTTCGTATSPPRPRSSRSTTDGRRRDVVAQIGKNGRTYVLDRETGEPVYPMEEVKAPPSDVPGRAPVANAAAAHAAAAVHAAEVHRGPDHEADARRRRRQSARNGRRCARRGEFDPPSLQGTVLFPGMDGGGEWGGVAFDPTSGLLYVNANEMAWRVKLAERKLPDGKPTTGKVLYQTYCASCHRADCKGNPPEFPSLVGIGERRSVDEVSAHRARGRRPHARLRGHARGHAPRHRPVRGERHVGAVRARAGRTPFDVRVHARRRHPLRRPRRVSCDRAAVGHADGHRHEQGRRLPGRCRLARCPAPASRIPAARTTAGRSSPPAACSSSAPPTTTTSSARSTRATGAVLWETTLPAAGNATPAVYEVGGKQYVVIAAGGGKWGRRVRRQLRGVRAAVAAVGEQRDRGANPRGAPSTDCCAMPPGRARCMR